MMATTLIKRNLGSLSEKINKAYSTSISALRTTLERAIECGTLLNEAKSQLKHGEWLPWLEENCPEIARNTASGWMRLAKSNVRPSIHLGVKEAQKLLSGPPPDCDKKPSKKPEKPKESPASAPEPAEDQPLPIPEREAGDEASEPEHTAPESDDGSKTNRKLDFDDKIIDQAFSKLIKAVDDRARALKQMNTAYHKTCLNKLDAFMKAFKEWKAARR